MTHERPDGASILVVIPARGGSKGIPRKNLRALAGRPLLSYAIETSLGSKHAPTVCVSSDDDEILGLATKFGVVTHRRGPASSGDAATLDPVVHEATRDVERTSGCRYDIVVTLQPTSPLLRTVTLDRALDRLLDEPGLDTLIAAKEDTHLRWRKEGNGFAPAYEERLNRQFLPPTFQETGAFVVTRGECVTTTSRFGPNVSLFLLEGPETIDIDTYDDWALCEFHLQRRRVLFVVSGHAEIGLGHVYNALLIANDLVDHELAFLVDAHSRMAFDKIASLNYPVSVQEHDDILTDIAEHRPDLVINDRLSTDRAYMSGLAAMGVRSVNIEDLGEGAALADLVINAIYPEGEARPNHYYGHRFFCLRDEFLLTTPREIADPVQRVLVTFGGVDPNNFTRRVIDEIEDECARRGIEIHVVAGFGYDAYDTLSGFGRVQVHRHVSDISEHMSAADLIFTSAGRTTFEVASLGVPAIVVAQNRRETTHFFASQKHGFVNLGLGTDLGDGEILAAFRRLIDAPELRRHMSSVMRQVDLAQGRRNVSSLIRGLLETL